MKVTVNGEAREIPDGTTLGALLLELGLENRPIAVELNLQVVPRQRHSGTSLSGGDRLEIVTLVGGG